MGIRLIADRVVFVENEKLKGSKMYHVMVYIKEGSKHTGKNLGETYI